jgi:hypothetical protein
MSMRALTVVGLILSVAMGACGGAPDGEPTPTDEKQAVEEPKGEPTAKPEDSLINRPSPYPGNQIANRCVGCPQGGDAPP